MNASSDSDLTWQHTSVLWQESLDALNIRPGLLYVDATAGAGGHTVGILQRCQPDGQVISIDQDPYSLDLAARRVQAEAVEAVPTGRWRGMHGNYSQLAELLGPLSPNSSANGLVTGGILADLGVASFHFDQAERGFSFSREAPLDMRMNPKSLLTATEIVNHWPESELVRIFTLYGEARFAKTIARKITEQRKQSPFETTTQLAKLISGIYQSGPAKNDPRRIHPATQVFQALRIAVNDELGHLERFLQQIPDLLAPGARVAIISFHSLEDRLVKQAFQQASRDCICPPRLPVCQCHHRASLRIIASKPLVATDVEVAANPRSRSAKLRVAEKVN